MEPQPPSPPAAEPDSSPFTPSRASSASRQDGNGEHLHLNPAGPEDSSHPDESAVAGAADLSTDPVNSATSNGNTHTSATPVFWTSHGRSISSVSYQSLLQRRGSGGPIALEDHSAENHELSLSCWAQSATIDDYVVVSGPTGIGAYVVWQCTVQTLKGGDICIRKRYSEFDQLRTDLVRSFPHADAMIPQLPRKSVVSRFRSKFLEQRKAGLTHFLNCILLNPEFAASPVLKDFIFS